MISIHLKFLKFSTTFGNLIQSVYSDNELNNPISIVVAIWIVVRISVFRVTGWCRKKRYRGGAEM